MKQLLYLSIFYCRNENCGAYLQGLCCTRLLCFCLGVIFKGKHWFVSCSIDISVEWIFNAYSMQTVNVGLFYVRYRLFMKLISTHYEISFSLKIFFTFSYFGIVWLPSLLRGNNTFDPKVIPLQAAWILRNTQRELTK